MRWGAPNGVLPSGFAAAGLGFDVDDAWLCPDCGARMGVHAVVQGLAIADVLTSLGQPGTRTDPLPARAPPTDWELVA